VSLRDDATKNLHEIIRFVTFMRGYAEGLHHELEETVLLPTLAVATGFQRDSGVLAFIRDQHREEERLLLDLEKAAAAEGPWNDDVAERIARAARKLTDFERAHMAKEYELLFPFAQKALATHAEEVDSALAAFFRRREPRFDGPWLQLLGKALVEAHPKRA
jgi:hemerythrin-like domain-containing protein